MGTGILIDTNAVIDFQSGQLPTAALNWMVRMIDEGAGYLSVINRIELFIRPGDTNEEAALRQFVASCQVLPLDEPVVLQTIRLRQQHRVKLPDAIIAATALVHGLLLLSRNTSDFRTVAGLTLLNPHEPDGLPA